MSIHKSLIFLFQALTLGIAAFLVIAFFKPELLQQSAPVVEVKQAPVTGLTATPGIGPVSYADAVAEAAPAVVNIYTSKVISQRHPIYDDPFLRRFFGDRFPAPSRERLETSLGSGVIVSAQGYILTSNHVIAGAEEIQVALTEGRSASATVVGTDPDTDLAVLRIDLPTLPSATVGRSEDLRVGDVVLAIGNPFGVGQTVTLGIVSATGRNRLGISTFENFIQTDAAINPGNSGGALINARGAVIGINTAIYSKSGGSQGIGFAIPMSLAQDVMRQIIENGRVVRGWLGIEAQDVTPNLAESFKIPAGSGVIVAGVLRNGPADQAGLRPGDVIIQINDSPVRGARSVLDLIARAKPGNKVVLQVLRAGENLSLEAIISERPNVDT